MLSKNDIKEDKLMKSFTINNKNNNKKEKLKKHEKNEF